MARPLKAYSGWIIAEKSDQARHNDGRGATQIQAAVLARSKAAAADLVGVTAHHVSQYWSETGNAEQLAALAEHPPGTVIIQPTTPTGTVMGQPGIVVRYNAKEIAQRHRDWVTASREQTARVKASVQADREARADRQTRTEQAERRTREIIDEVAPLLEALGILPRTVEPFGGKVVIPTEAFATLVRLAIDGDRWE